MVYFDTSNYKDKERILDKSPFLFNKIYRTICFIHNISWECMRDRRRRRFGKTHGFLQSLKAVAGLAEKSDTCTMEQIFEILSGKGYPALLIAFSLPFCLPIQIPGFSFPFGAVIAFLALRMAFAQKLWWPQRVLDKEMSSAKVKVWAKKCMQLVNFFQKIVHPRMLVLTRNVLLHRGYGVTIFILALLLALPLPIPFSNTLCALPIFFIALGLLEDDGLMIIIGYGLSLVCFAFFAALFIYGKEFLVWLF